jgi:hypothetical protein
MGVVWRAIAFESAPPGAFEVAAFVAFILAADEFDVGALVSCGLHAESSATASASVAAVEIKNERMIFTPTAET